MFSVVAASGLVGFLTSVTLLHLHLRSMWSRYGLSVAAAYGAFLILVWVWILYYRRRWNRIVRSGSLHSNGKIPDDRRAKAASGNTLQPGGRHAGSDSDFDFGDLFDLLEVLDAIGPILLLAAMASVIAAIGYLISVVVLAPELMAEMLLDGVFSLALYHRMQQIEQQNWLESAVKRTRRPFLWLLLFFICAGIFGRVYAPEAASIGGVVQHALAVSRPGISRR